MLKRCLYLFFVLPLFLTACDQQDGGLTAPERGSASASPQSAATAPELSSESYDVSDRHLVLLKGNTKKFEKKAEKLGAEVTAFYEDAGFAIVSGLSDKAADKLRTSKGVAEVQRDATFSLDPADKSGTTSATPQSPSNPSAAFFFPRQWHHRAINADDAWEAGRLGSSDVTVAILDSGIDYLHADLQGLVDLDRSASFVPIDDQLTEFYFPNRHPITDLDGHGTHVSATVSSNAVAAAGVTSQTTLIGAKVCSVLGGCAFGAIFEGLLHAANNDADVINMSLGGAFSKAGNGRFVGFINRMFNQVKKSGALVVVAAGNDSTDLQHNGNTFATYCDAPHVVCVAATGPTDGTVRTGPWENVTAPAPYTNFGRSAITVAAPGGTGNGFVWEACSSTSLVYPNCQASPFFILGLAGTSMAAPHTAGTAALLMARGKSKPSQVRNALRKSADDLGPNGNDPYYGKGFIDVADALGL